MRLIDADELCASMDRRYCESCRAEKMDYGGVRCRACWIGDALGEIDDAPTIDPKDLQPHGHWIAHHSGGLICSHCNHYIASDWRSLCCPICGARLDGEVEYDG